MLNELADCVWHSPAREVCVATRRAGYVLRTLDESYSLLLVVRPLGTFAVSRRALDETAFRILTEAGLDADRIPEWYRGRPRRVRPIAPLGARDHDSPWLEVEVLGALVGLGAKERGFRIRLASGAEVMLLRESRRLWFVDDRIDVSNQALLTGRSGDVFGGKGPRA